jgi:hypothetical protein
LVIDKFVATGDQLSRFRRGFHPVGHAGCSVKPEPEAVSAAARSACSKMGGWGAARDVTSMKLTLLFTLPA